VLALAAGLVDFVRAQAAWSYVQLRMDTPDDDTYAGTGAAGTAPSGTTSEPDAVNALGALSPSSPFAPGTTSGLSATSSPLGPTVYTFLGELSTLAPASCSEAPLAARVRAVVDALAEGTGLHFSCVLCLLG
jgi:hypothetical protein